MTRPKVSRTVQRDVLFEAGYRCAIPTCRQPTVEIAHIVSWKKVQNNDFGNLIALCPTCHTRYDRGEIDPQAMLRYKANLSILNNRYGDLERRVLALFAAQPDAFSIKLPGGTQIQVLYLIKDGYLVHIGSSSGQPEENFPNHDIYQITREGREFVKKWLDGQDIT